MTTTLARTGLGLVVAAGLALLFAVSSPAAAPGTSSAKGCHLSAREQQHLGPTYVTSLSVSHTSCSHGKAVVRAFHRCRKAHGRQGRCHHKVLGYRCREHRGYGQGEFSSRVTCTKGRARVTHTYTQFI